MNCGNHDDSETELTAYHEAGHAVIAYALGGHVESLQLGGEADDRLPERFGDCRVHWEPIPTSDAPGGSASRRWQIEREVMTILAGPAAEMIYSGEPYHPALFVPWQDDWRRASACIEPIVADPRHRTRLLEEIVKQLYHRMKSDSIWPAIAAVADELQAHEFLESDQLDEVVGFWFRRS